MTTDERQKIVEQGLAAIRELMSWWVHLTTYRDTAAALCNRRDMAPGTVAQIRDAARSIAKEVKPG